MRRVVIVGCTGSGKTTLAKKLSEKMNIPAVDFDDINWLPDWQERDYAEACRMVVVEAQKPVWIISGNYSKFQELFLPQADTMIWLDYSFPRNLWQLLSRSVTRVLRREVICNGNIETWHKLFSRDSIILWLFKTFRKNRRKYAAFLANPPGGMRVVHHKTPRETERWLQALIPMERTSV